MKIEKFQFYRATHSFVEALRTVPAMCDIRPADIWAIVYDYRDTVVKITPLTPEIRSAFQFIVTEVTGRIYSLLNPRITTSFACSIESLCNRIEDYVDDFTGYSKEVFCHV